MVGAGSPAVPGVITNFRVADAVYQPRITERVLAATHQASRATTNDTLLATALAYTNRPAFRCRGFSFAYGVAHFL